MGTATQKTLTFPMAGVARNAGYREQSRPYSAPWAYNVRGSGPVESRRRGGSRPGLQKAFTNSVAGVIGLVPVAVVDGSDRFQFLVAINSSGSLSLCSETDDTIDVIVSILMDDTGATIVTDDSEDIEFGALTDAVTGIERGGKVLLPGSSLQEFDPITGIVETVAPSLGEVPSGCPIIALYRDRVFLAGANHLWYASRQSDPTDWQFSADMGDVGAPMAGHLADGGKMGEKITALIPIDDSKLLMATADEVWVLNGDPADGTLSLVSRDVGIIAPGGWARSADGTIAFLSKDGIYLMSGTGRPERWSEDRIPGELQEIDADDYSISMDWDAAEVGFHLFLTPVDETANGLHWWLDMQTRSFWPVVFGALDMNPVAAASLNRGSDVTATFMAGRDGYIRVFDSAATSDDGEAIVSQVVVGPVRLPGNDFSDALLTEMFGMMAGDSSASVDWRVVAGSNAEDVASDAKDAVVSLQSGGAVDSYRSGSWGAGRNVIDRPRVRGAWCAVCLYSETKWAYEAMAIKGLVTGRLRHGY